MEVGKKKRDKENNLQERCNYSNASGGENFYVLFIYGRGVWVPTILYFFPPLHTLLECKITRGDSWRDVHSRLYSPQDSNVRRKKGLDQREDFYARIQSTTKVRHTKRESRKEMKSIFDNYRARYPGAVQILFDCAPVIERGPQSRTGPDDEISNFPQIVQRFSIVVASSQV